MSKRARQAIDQKNRNAVRNFSAVGKPRSSIEYVYHVSTLDYSHLTEAQFEIKLPYINNVESIEILSAYVPANLDSFHGKKLVMSMTEQKVEADQSTTTQINNLTLAFDNDMGFANAAQRKKLTDKIVTFSSIIDPTKQLFNDAKISTAEANSPFKMTLIKNSEVTITAIEFRWDDQTKEESLKNTLGFHGSGSSSAFKNKLDENDQPTDEWQIESPNQCNWMGHNFLILRTPSLNIDSAFAVENPPYHHTNVLSILHTPHESLGVHFNKEWFRPILVRNSLNSLHTFILQVYHEDGRLVKLNGGQFLFTFKIIADSY
jgi:hypothetical protein